MAVAVPAMGFGLHYGLRGLEPMVGEIELWLIYTLASSSMLFSIIYTWNLACAP